MNFNRRLKAVGAVLALAAVVTSTHVWGEPSDRTLKDFRSTSGQITPSNKPERDLVEDLTQSRFSDAPMLTYKTTAGDSLFAWQVKPTLPTAAPRPRDVLILVDISASQVKAPLRSAIEITDGLLAQVSNQDRVTIWTVNSSVQEMARGFHHPRSEAIADAVKKLKLAVPLGDTDLKAALQQANRAFSGDLARQQVILFLGDGLSVHHPFEDNAERARVCQELVKSEIQFYAVPLGPKLDSANLHGLSTGTGGSVVRLLSSDRTETFLKRLHSALSATVFYPRQVEYSADITEAYPTRLPPLRSDAPTLVVGRYNPCEKVRANLEGAVAGQVVRVQLTQTVPTPETENFFLSNVVYQWARAKDQPALARAERVLAFAYENTQLARSELLAQAQWALALDNLDAATNLFQQAQKLDPTDPEAMGGLKLIEGLRNGTLTKDKLRAQLNEPLKGIKIEKHQKEKVETKRDQLLALAPQQPDAPQQPKEGQPAAPAQVPPPIPQPPAGGGAPAPITPANEREDLLQLQKQRLAVEEQHATQLVDDAEREARRILPADPDAAKERLKQVLSSIRDNPDLSERTRLALVNRLESAIRNVEIRGAVIKRDKDEAARALADYRSRMERMDLVAHEEERTRRRMQVFANLMREARYVAAAEQALAVARDAVDTGHTVPPAATAGYQMASLAYNQKEFEELRRIKEERYLLTMLEVERSSVPFSDEPPIHYPPANQWRAMTRLRKEKYESTGLAEDDPVTLQAVRQLKAKLNQRVTLEKGFEANTRLTDALDFLSARFDLTILVDEQAFDADIGVKEVQNTPVQLPKMVNVTLGTVLRLLLSKIPGTYLIRRDYIEVTTAQRATAEKTLRVYPVADLVIPIPQSVNQRVLNQTLTILGTAPGIGLQLGSPLALGAGGALGALGAGGLGALGALGIGGLGIGGLGIGGLGAAGGAALGLAGGGLTGAGGGFGGNLGFQGGQVNLGAGGGALGFGGGQLGQFGNLGGQFGLQGGDQSIILIQLIRQVIGRPDDWAIARGFNRSAPFSGTTPTGSPTPDDDPGAATDIQLANDLGYYPPALALVVKGTSRVHLQEGGILAPRPGPPGMGAAQGFPKNAVVFEGGKGRRKDDNQVAANAKPKERDLKQELKDPKARQQLAQLDPKTIWQDALARGVNDPGLIIAVSDFLFERGRFEHVAEFLKANLRQGIVVRPWVYEALAIALEASGGSPEDQERARLSLVDLEPEDAQGYLTASKALAGQKRYDRAVAMCRQAARLEPNSPAAYTEALVFAELAKDGEAMDWAASNLLKRDWTNDNANLHGKATGRLKNLAAALEKDGHKAEAERMVQAVKESKIRDLQIQVSWQGDADLDLEVKEPIGSLCSFVQRQTTAGGTLLGDEVQPKGQEVRKESYVAARAFSGDYQVTVRRVYGRPLGGKATVEVIRHQGTPREERERHTVLVDASRALTVKLADGRRTATEHVAPPIPRSTQSGSEDNSPNSALLKLRALAEPDLREEGGIRGGVGSLLSTATAPASKKKGDAAPVVQYETRVAPTSTAGLDLTSKAVLLSDGRVKVSVKPVFQTVHQDRPMMNLPFLPGNGIAPANP